MGVCVVDNKDKFLKMIENNLKSNGFPLKKVAFEIEKIYEIADKYNLSFNSLKEDLETKNISYEITTEKVIFFAHIPNEDNQDMFTKAQEMLSKMDPAEIARIQKMYENMSESEKADLMEKAKGMGLY